MAEIIKTEGLPDGGIRRFFDDGRVMDFNAKGQIVGSKLPPGVAAEIGKKGGSREHKLDKEATDLLAELNLSGVKAAETLARIAVSGKTNAVTAFRELWTLATLQNTQPVKTGSVVDRPPDWECPGCGLLKRQLDFIELVIEIAEQVQAEAGGYPCAPSPARGVKSMQNTGKLSDKLGIRPAGFIGSED